MMVKICGITNRDDALAAVEEGAVALGFNFWPRSPRYITPEHAAEIASEIPDTILRVGVFVDGVVDEVVQRSCIQVAQIHGDLTEPPAMEWWQAWPATLDGIGDRIARSAAKAFLIDTPAGAARGGTGKTYDWTLAAGLPGRVILAGGLHAKNVAQAIEIAQPWGVDACSRLEIGPGKKDHQKMRGFLRAALSMNL